MASSYIFLNTDDSLNPNTPYDSSFNLNSKINDLSSTKMALSTVQFSNTVYPINSFYNTFVCQENNALGTMTLTLAPNNYTGTQIASYLQTVMNAGTTQATVYTVSYNSQSKFLTFSGTNNFKILATSTCLRELGISSRGMSSPQITFICDYPVELSGSRYIDVISNLSSKSVSSNNYTNILVRIPLAVSFGEVVIYQSSAESSFTVFNQDLCAIDLRLIDDRNNQFILPANSPISYTFRMSN